ncbi:DUF5753 domain-containing protein, partial [Streptomyces sp. SM14]
YNTNYLIILWEIAQKDPSQFKLRYRRYMEMENEATSIQIYSPCVIPGLLQTEAYARELLSVGGLQGVERDRQVEARMGRQEKLRADGSPYLRAIISEAALRTPLPDPSRWRDQLRHLLDACDRARTSLQVAPLTAGIHALTNTYVDLLRLPEGRSVAWVESGYSGELVEETGPVERFQLSYDQLRDQALSLNESRQLITETLEDVECDPVST